LNGLYLLLDQQKNNVSVELTQEYDGEKIKTLPNKPGR